MAILMALVLLGQGVASAHAASYGDAHHEHEGVVCDVALLAEEADNLLPPPALFPPTITDPSTPTWETPFGSVTLTTPPARAPPPRAPPARI